VAVAQELSLSRAAAALNVSQPSLSVAIDRVEARLGDRIFLRGKGASIMVTPQGHRFVDQARDLIPKAYLVEVSLETARPTFVGCSEDIAPWYLPKTRADIRGQLTDMRFEGREGRFCSLAADMRESFIDLVIAYDIGFDGLFDRMKLKQVAPVAFLSPQHPLAIVPEIELHQLVEHPLTLSHEDLSVGFTLGPFDRLNVMPTIIHRPASLEMLRSLAAHSAGIGISYSNPPTAHSYDGQPLVTVPIRTPEALADIVLVWPTITAPEPKTMQVVEAIHAMW
jgi:DNA-binding transcriptional LysR family regulator